MIFVDYPIPVPFDKGHKFDRKKNKNHVMLYVRIRSFRENGKLKHDGYSIGKISLDEDGNEILLPNDNYFIKFKGIPCPTNSKVRLRGRPNKGDLPCKTKNIKDNAEQMVGYSIAYSHFVKELGLIDILEESFGYDMARKIIQVTSFFCLGMPFGLSNIENYCENHYIFSDIIMTSQHLSKLYKEIDESSIANFLSAWMQHHNTSKTACYDVTSISNYSRNLSMIERGYNRDKEDLDQLNLGMFCDMESKIPLFYSIYNGSLNDHSNLKEIILKARHLGLSKTVTLITDGGFANKTMLNKLKSLNLNFIMGAPKRRHKDIENVIKNWLLSTPLGLCDKFSYDNDIFLFHETSVDIADKTYRLILYVSNQSYMFDSLNFNDKIEMQENYLKSKNKLTKQELKKYEKFFKINIKDKKIISIERDNDAIKDYLLMSGAFALISNNEDLSPKELLVLYKDKDIVEKSFNMLKNDIINERLYVSNDDSLRGKMFLIFIALIVRKYFLQKVIEFRDTKHKYTLESVFAILSDIKCYKHNDIFLLPKNLTAKQKFVVDKLNLPFNIKE